MFWEFNLFSKIHFKLPIIYDLLSIGNALFMCHYTAISN